MTADPFILRMAFVTIALEATPRAATSPLVRMLYGAGARENTDDALVEYVAAVCGVDAQRVRDAL